MTVYYSPNPSSVPHGHAITPPNVSCPQLAPRHQSRVYSFSRVYRIRPILPLCFQLRTLDPVARARHVTSCSTRHSCQAPQCWRFSFQGRMGWLWSIWIVDSLNIAQEIAPWSFRVRPAMQSSIIALKDIIAKSHMFPHRFPGHDVKHNPRLAPDRSSFPHFTRLNYPLCLHDALLRTTEALAVETKLRGEWVGSGRVGYGITQETAVLTFREHGLRCNHQPSSARTLL